MLYINSLPSFITAFLYITYFNDLTQHMNEWTEVWPQHRELQALLFTNSEWVLLRPTGLWEIDSAALRNTP